ncbi:mitochondrial 54S ribosomal protein YmL9 [Teratosphaeria nubilosa]|uniref:Large ribosomal subunit protein uL3m n=1 Tax=Teratosphaeria nubilosa TaxID=161662 RepID=A0A6G1LDA1_9PEZI|nr:mitochondrial 54S ribosomal protein YmL9 [Teratosphaeria nubilosa]
MPPSTVPRLFSIPPRFLCPGLPRNAVFQSQKRGIKSIQPRQRNPVNRYNNGAGLPKLESSRQAAFERKEPMLPLRTGALLIKKGMSAIYDPATSKRIPCTVLQLDRCQVTGHKRRDKHGYWAVQVGMGTKEARNVTRPGRGHFAAQGVPIKKHLAEFRVKNEEGLPAVGSNITADLFQPGQFVDVRGVTRGMGFTGGMKRWGWGGQPASHGNSKTHRAMGSSGASQGSGSRVHPGKHMPGRMGAENNTVQNLKILQVDKENGIVVVSGPVSGPKYSIVRVQDAIKKPWPQVDLALGVSRMGSTSEKLEAAVA